MRLSYNCYEKYHQFQTNEEYKIHWTCNEIKKNEKTKCWILIIKKNLHVWFYTEIKCFLKRKQYCY